MLSSHTKSVKHSSRTYKAVLFDMDDTLIDRTSAYEFSYKCFYFDNPAINQTVPWEEAREFFLSLSKWKAREPKEAFEIIAKKWTGVKGDPQTHEKQYYQRIIQSINLFKGTEKILKKLNNNDISWGIVTNGAGKYQIPKLQKTGLDKLTPFAIVSGVFGIDKPHKSIFLEALKLLNSSELNPQDTLFIGDNPYTDILGASATGMATAWLSWNREYPEDIPKPNYVLNSIQNMGNLIDSCLIKCL